VTIEEALYTKLSGTAAISTLVAARIYPAPLAQEIANPCISYQRIDTPREYSHGGYSSLAVPRFQVDCLADTYEGAYALANAVRQAVQGSSGTWGSVSIYACFVVDERDSFEENPRTFRRSLDLQIHHEES
jgi:hypothetical protein